MSWLIEAFLDEDNKYLDDGQLNTDNDMLYEAFYDILEEGANIDNTKTFLAGKKEFKAEAKLAKKAIKDGQKAKAKKHISNMKKTVDKMEKSIKNTKGDASSAVCGFFASGLVNCIAVCIPICGAIVGEEISLGSAMLCLAGGWGGSIPLFGAGAVGVYAGKAITFTSTAAAVIAAFVEVGGDVYNLVQELKNPNSRKEDAMNLYRNKLLMYISVFKTKITKMESML